MADLAKLPQSQIARMEREVLSLRLDTMIKIGEILGIDFFIKKNRSPISALMIARVNSIEIRHGCSKWTPPRH